MANYSASEIRKAIYNCKTIAELNTLEFMVTVQEAINYSEKAIKYFEWHIQKHRMALQEKTK